MFLIQLVITKNIFSKSSRPLLRRQEARPLSRHQFSPRPQLPPLPPQQPGRRRRRRCRGGCCGGLGRSPRRGAGRARAQGLHGASATPLLRGWRAGRGGGTVWRDGGAQRRPADPLPPPRARCCCCCGDGLRRRGRAVKGGRQEAPLDCHRSNSDGVGGAGRGALGGAGAALLRCAAPRLPLPCLPPSRPPARCSGRRRYGVSPLFAYYSLHRQYAGTIAAVHRASMRATMAPRDLQG
jgi:hypothetical protein